MSRAHRTCLARVARAEHPRSGPGQALARNEKFSPRKQDRHARFNPTLMQQPNPLMVRRSAARQPHRDAMNTKRPSLEPRTTPRQLNRSRRPPVRVAPPRATGRSELRRARFEARRPTVGEFVPRQWAARTSPCGWREFSTSRWRRTVGTRTRASISAWNPNRPNVVYTDRLAAQFHPCSRGQPVIGPASGLASDARNPLSSTHSRGRNPS